MNTIELKNNFHILIDTIENENILLNFYELLKNRVSKTNGKLWDSLTDSEKQELLLSIEESNDEANLISDETIKEKYKKWL